MNRTPLRSVEKVKYLGIYLTWYDHINYICNKANRLLSFLKRNLYFCHKHFKEHYQTDISKLEMVQHQAARFVLNKPWNRHHHDSITEILQELNWPSFQQRRKQARLILLYKLLIIYYSSRVCCLPSLNLSATRFHHNQKFHHFIGHL